jgi:hypothetical protein
VKELTCNAIREFRLAHHPQTPGELLDQPVLLFASVVFFFSRFFFCCVPCLFSSYRVCPRTSHYVPIRSKWLGQKLGLKLKVQSPDEQASPIFMGRTAAAARE